MKINKNSFEFEFRQRARNTPLMADIWLQGIRDLIIKELRLKGLKAPDYLFTADSCGYVEKKYKEKVIRLITEEIHRKSNKYTPYVLSRLERVVVNFEIFCNKLKDKKPNSQTWEQFVKEMKLVTAWLYIPWYLTEENILTDMIAQTTDFDLETISILTMPDKEMLYQKEERSMYNLCKLKNQKALVSKLKIHVKQFSWMNSYYFLPVHPLTEKDFFKKINNFDVKKIETKFKDRDINLKKQKALTSNIADRSLKNLVLSSRKLAFWLTSSVERTLRSTATLYPWYIKLAEKIGVQFEDWNELTCLEISNILSGGNVPKQIHKRKNNFVAFMHEGDISFVFGERALGITKNMSEVDTKIEIKGQVAFKGMVKGTARIALTPESSYRLTESDVLVTSMTSPDYLSAMARVKAFITDEGGLLCHAAIVARELKKPCIIGTKIATKVLKDGDLVEVDTERGIVKILSKAK